MFVLRRIFQVTLEFMHSKTRNGSFKTIVKYNNLEPCRILDGSSRNLLVNNIMTFSGDAFLNAIHPCPYTVRKSTKFDQNIRKVLIFQGKSYFLLYGPTINFLFSYGFYQICIKFSHVLDDNIFKVCYVSEVISKEKTNYLG